MSREFREQFDKVRAWAAEAQSAGWLTERDLEGLHAMETDFATELFHDRDRRPLIVAFLGGTGVGKSSLLNRLAGHPVAKVGVRRPTSTEATMYVHRSQALNVFAEGSPIADTRVEYHDVEARRDVAWLDMPDIDSVEAGNRRLVLAWLPYVDWLVYVVSPERYRDDIGRQLLERRHRKHHWLFVVNRWDEAVDVQLPDFAADLVDAGFGDPLVLRTSCTRARDDDFDRLEDIINKAIQDHGLAELQRIGVLARLEELEKTANDMRRRLGSSRDWDVLRDQCAEQIERRLDMYGERLGADLEVIAQQYPPRPAIWRADPIPPVLPEQEISKTIGTAYTNDLIADISMDMAVRVEEKGVRSGPLRASLQDALDNAGTLILAEIRNGIADAMKAPEGTAQRMTRRVMDVSVYMLPILAGLWVAWNVVSRYQQGISGENAFLGIDFAVHSLLMIGLSWFVPFLLSRWLRPSLRDAARRGIHSGLAKAAHVIKASLTQALDVLIKQRTALLAAFPEKVHPGGQK